MLLTSSDTRRSMAKFVTENGCGFCYRCIRSPRPWSRSTNHETFPECRFASGLRVSSEPQPDTYHCDELVDGLINHHTVSCLNPSTVLDRTFRCLHLILNNVNTSQGTMSLSSLKGLTDLSVLFDELLFSGLLRGRMSIHLVDTINKVPLLLGKTSDSPSRYGEVTITLKRPTESNTGVVSTELRDCSALIEMCNTLIHEMLHAVIRIYTCKCRDCDCLFNRCRTMGLDGHGPSFRRLGGWLEAWLQFTFGVYGTWHLDATDNSVSHEFEKEELRKHGLSQDHWLPIDVPVIPDQIG